MAAIPKKKTALRSAPAKKKLPPKDPKIAGISAAAVEKATGKPWAHWLAVLDKAGAAKLAHKDIAALLHDEHGVPDWWCQMVTVGYEQARGLRVKHQQASGFSASSSRTIAAPMAAAYKAWVDERTRATWLPDAPLTIRKATPGKSVRITWSHPPAKRGGEPRDTSVEVYFWDKSRPGAPRTLVQLQEGKLGSARDVAKSKEYWGAALDRLRETLE